MAHVTDTESRIERKCPLAGWIAGRASGQGREAPPESAAPPVCEMYKVTGTDACSLCLMLMEDTVN